MNSDAPLIPPNDRGRISVMLRTLAGVRESVLDLVPSERARYASMGGVVVGTAAIAALSMAVALYSVFGTLANLAAIPFTVLWGLFILNLDRWLMSTTVNRDGLARMGKFLPRIGLALIFGIIIAEPLLLGVFNSAIEKQIRDERAVDLARLEATLVRCNPVSGPAARPSGCAAGDLLTVEADPDAIRSRLATRQGQAAQLRDKMTRDLANHKELNDKARQECAGLSGSGLSGRQGEGNRCRVLRRQADDYRTDNGMDGDATRLQDLDADIAVLSESLQQESTAYTEKITARIQERVTMMRSSQRQIGLLERLRALDALVSTNGYVEASGWALRVFFVTVDSLPVLVKMLTGRTAYDRVLAGRLAREERAQELAEGTAGYRDARQAAVQRFRIDLEGAAERDRASVRSRQAHAGTGEELHELIVAGAEEILRQTRGLRPPLSSNHSRREP